MGEDERQFQAERLMIDEVKNRPYLWDETLPEHKDQEKVKEAWDTVGRIFGLSGVKAKSRWKSMRDIYVRYLRKLALKGGTVPKWKHFDAMGFIADHIRHRRGDLQYSNVGGGILVTTGASADAEGVGTLPNNNYDNLYKQEDEEDSSPDTSKRVTRNRKRKRPSVTATATANIVGDVPSTSSGVSMAAATTRLAPVSSAPVLRPSSMNGNTSTGGLSDVMPLHQTSITSTDRRTAVADNSGGAVGMGQQLQLQQPQQQQPPQHQQQVQHQQQQQQQPTRQIQMVSGNGLIPVTTTMNSVPNTSGGMTMQQRGGNHQEATTFTIDEDADELFGRAVAATLKKMPARMKALSKLRIQQVLYELEEASANSPPPNANVIYQATMVPSSQPQQPLTQPAPQVFM